jgi:hypothetical protein
MITNKTYTVLPFYEDVNQQWFRIMQKDYDTVAVICPKNRFIPWEIQRNFSLATIQEIDLVEVCTGNIEDITSIIDMDDIVITTANGKDYIQYLGSLDLSEDLDCGFFYLIVVDEDRSYYSEIFEVKDFTDNLNNTLIWDDNSNPIMANDTDNLKG